MKQHTLTKKLLNNTKKALKGLFLKKVLEYKKICFSQKIK